jgi:hypothetical protein
MPANCPLIWLLVNESGVVKLLSGIHPDEEGRDEHGRLFSNQQSVTTTLTKFYIRQISISTP